VETYRQNRVTKEFQENEEKKACLQNCWVYNRAYFKKAQTTRKYFRAI